MAGERRVPWNRERDGRGVLDIIGGRSRMHDHRPSHPYNTGMEHVGLSPTGQIALAPIAKLRGVFGESHEGVSCILLRNRLRGGLARWGWGARLRILQLPLRLGTKTNVPIGSIC